MGSIWKLLLTSWFWWFSYVGLCVDLDHDQLRSLMLTCLWLSFNFITVDHRFRLWQVGLFLHLQRFRGTDSKVYPCFQRGHTLTGTRPILNRTPKSCLSGCLSVYCLRHLLCSFWKLRRTACETWARHEWSTNHSHYGFDSIAERISGVVRECPPQPRREMGMHLLESWY